MSTDSARIVITNAIRIETLFMMTPVRQATVQQIYDVSSNLVTRLIETETPKTGSGSTSLGNRLSEFFHKLRLRLYFEGEMMGFHILDAQLLGILF